MQKWQSNQEIISKNEHSIYNYFQFICRMEGQFGHISIHILG